MVALGVALWALGRYPLSEYYSFWDYCSTAEKGDSLIRRALRKRKVYSRVYFTMETGLGLNIS